MKFWVSSIALFDLSGELVRPLMIWLSSHERVVRISNIDWVWYDSILCKLISFFNHWRQTVSPISFGSKVEFLIMHFYLHHEFSSWGFRPWCRILLILVKYWAHSSILRSLKSNLARSSLSLFEIDPILRYRLISGLVRVTFLSWRDFNNPSLVLREHFI